MGLVKLRMPGEGRSLIDRVLSIGVEGEVQNGSKRQVYLYNRERALTLGCFV